MGKMYPKEEKGKDKMKREKKNRSSVFIQLGIGLSIFLFIIFTKSMSVHASVNMDGEVEKYGKAAGGNVTVSRDSDGVYSITNMDDDEFRILQITDTHFCVWDGYYDRNVKAMNAVYQLVQDTHPDLIVVTGDFIFGTKGSGIAEDKAALDYALEFMDNIGIPWIWTFGNHDHCFFDKFSDSEISKMLSESETLLQYEENSSIQGYTNGEFRLYNADGSLNSIIIALDSNSPIYNNTSSEAVDYDYIRDNQVNWYKKIINNEKKRFGDDVQSFVYTHIPITEYDDIWNLYEAGSSKVIYHFGAKREEVCCSSKRSKLASAMVQLKSTKAIFCGHDHVNDYSISYKGIQYVYGKSIDYSAYLPVDIEHKTEQRGGTQLILPKDGGYHVLPVQLTDVEAYNESLAAEYDAVFDAEYYHDHNADVAAVYGYDESALLSHFINYGMSEARQAKETFEVNAYKEYDEDLEAVFGADLVQYYEHYIVYGQYEHRKTTSLYEVYDPQYYYDHNLDLQEAFGYDEEVLLRHFINYGMAEGRQAKELFEVNAYKEYNKDLQAAFGTDLEQYYRHYIDYGQYEHRKATSLYEVYDPQYYYDHHLDLQEAFEYDEKVLLQHFIDYGMSEGRTAIESFRVEIYKDRYSDLQKAFGDQNKLYYYHYIQYGMYEEREAA